MSVDQPVIKVGTRGSKLALVQTAGAVAELRLSFRDVLGRDSKETWPEFSVETIQTWGDKHRHDADEYGKTLNSEDRSRKWTLEVERKVHEREVQVAIHSGKDLPFKTFPKTLYVPIFEREDPRDAIVFKGDRSAFVDLPPGISIGTNSARRRACVRKFCKSASFKEYSGNVTTRVDERNMKEKGVDAAILAASGVKRLGLFDPEVFHTIDPIFSVPAGNQGILAAQLHQDCDPTLLSAVERLSHCETFIAWHSERSFLEWFDANCDTPLGVYCHVKRTNKHNYSCRINCFIPHLKSDTFTELTITRELQGSFDQRDEFTLICRGLGQDLAKLAIETGAQEHINGE